MITKATEQGRRGTYNKYTAKEKAKVVNHAVMHGTSARAPVKMSSNIMHAHDKNIIRLNACATFFL